MNIHMRNKSPCSLRKLKVFLFSFELSVKEKKLLLCFVFCCCAFSKTLSIVCKIGLLLPSGYQSKKKIYEIKRKDKLLNMEIVVFPFSVFFFMFSVFNH